MKIKDFNQDEYKYEIDMCDFENFFDIYEDKRNNYSYNLNENLYLNFDASNCEVFTLKHDMHWPLIAYHIYNTPNLAWLLCKINSIKNPVTKIPSGTNVFYLPKQDLTTILQEINNR